MSAATITRQLADLLVKERAIRAAMRTPIGREKYQQHENELLEIERNRADLEDQLERLQSGVIARGLSC